MLKIFKKYFLIFINTISIQIIFTSNCWKLLDLQYRIVLLGQFPLVGLHWCRLGGFPRVLPLVRHLCWPGSLQYTEVLRGFMIWRNLDKWTSLPSNSLPPPLCGLLIWGALLRLVWWLWWLVTRLNKVIILLLSRFLHLHLLLLLLFRVLIQLPLNQLFHHW